MHAIIEVNGPGDVSIIDLGSTKGTFVNGQKVNKAKLQTGDTIVVGETRIELAIGAGEEAEASRRASNIGAAPARADVVAPARRSGGRIAPPRARPRRAAPRRARGRPPPAARRAPRRPSPRRSRPRFAPPPGMCGPALYGARERAGRWLSAAMAGEADDIGARAPSRSPRCSVTPSSA